MGIKDWVLLGLLTLVVLIRWFKSRPGRVSGKKPGQSHGKVVQILQEAGYEVLTVKPTLNVTMEIDGRTHPFELKNDYIVKRGGRRYLVRIRRDNKTVRLQSKLWRGSLLRDVVAFRTSGILIVHLEKETIQVVRFHI
ncbi:MAG: hypothetical protein NUK65_09395 [Firmicutes bacterium]|nr:hypothetical protein [Bacillota bacterium]